MKYKEIVKIIKNISFALPDVQSFYCGDVYEVNADQTVKYSSVVLTNQEHSFDNVNDRFQYNFILFYIDRLTDDEANRTDVHTAAVSALKTIVQRLEDYNVIINDFKFNLFRERFNDSCAGAYATLSIEVEDNDCTEEFDFTYGQISADKLKEISITTNGVYTPDEGYYYTKVAVNVEPPLQSKTIEINENGTSTIVADSEHYGLGSVNLNVNVPTQSFETEELNVTANGTYTPSTDGFSKVNVAVPIPTFETEELSVTENGSYTPSTDGFSKVNVNVEPNLQSKTIEITENGQNTIVADSNYDGLEAVNIEVNVSATASKFVVPNGMKFSLSDVFDPEMFDISQVSDMSEFFYNCTNLFSLDLSTWNTAGVTSMESMFSYCAHLGTINIDGWNTAGVTSMKSMFNWCGRLTSLNLRHFSVDNVTSMSNMFYRATHLESLDISTWNCARVTSMDSMFWNCSGLTNLNMNGAILPKIDLSNWGLEYSTALTVNSLVSVISALPRLNGESFTCTIGSTNLAKLSDGQIYIATNKGWTLS